MVSQFQYVQLMHQLHDQHFHQALVHHSHRDRVEQMAEDVALVEATSIQR
jgi:hypothetical protein